MPRRGMDYVFEPATAGFGGLAGLKGMPAVTSVACLLLAWNIYIFLLLKYHGTMDAMTLPGGKSPFSDFPNKIKKALGKSRSTSLMEIQVA